MNTGKDYFDINYADYEKQNPARKTTYYINQISRHWKDGVPKNAHDIGCGLGNFLTSLGSDWNIFGSDINAYAVEQARKKCQGGTFLVGSGAMEVLFDRPFGLVTAFDVLEHVPDLTLARTRISEQLVSGGLFVFVVPVYDGASGPIIRKLDKDPTHLHKYSRSFWLDWAEEQFEVLHWEGVVRYLLPGGWYLHLPTRMLKSHAPAILVVCRLRQAKSS